MEIANYLRNRLLTKTRVTKSLSQKKSEVTNARMLATLGSLIVKCHQLIFQRRKEINLIIYTSEREYLLALTVIPLSIIKYRHLGQSKYLSSVSNPYNDQSA